MLVPLCPQWSSGAEHWTGNDCAVYQLPYGSFEYHISSYCCTVGDSTYLDSTRVLTYIPPNLVNESKIRSYSFGSFPFVGETLKLHSSKGDKKCGSLWSLVTPNFVGWIVIYNTAYQNLGSLLSYQHLLEQKNLKPSQRARWCTQVRYSYFNKNKHNLPISGNCSHR